MSVKSEAICLSRFSIRGHSSPRVLTFFRDIVSLSIIIKQGKCSKIRIKYQIPICFPGVGVFKEIWNRSTHQSAFNSFQIWIRQSIIKVVSFDSFESNHLSKHWIQENWVKQHNLYKSVMRIQNLDISLNTTG